MMCGHISARAFDPSGLPATLSAPMVNYVRAHGYQGVIMTDALDMGAIVNHYSTNDAGVMAIKAGIDLVLLGANPSNDVQISVFRAVLHAVQSGEIPETQINAPVKRILQLKMAYKLLKWSPLSVEQTASRIASADGAKILAETYRAGLTEVRNVNG